LGGTTSSIRLPTFWPTSPSSKALMSWPTPRISPAGRPSLQVE